MKRNKHHGLNVEFDGLCMDFGHVSLNKKKEFLCGDCYKIEENDEDHVLVLSDGLGSGVKANILSTLTATMLSTMIINQVELDEAVRAVAKTLPVCSVRNLAYATFTVLNFQGKQVSLYQFDNPDAILIRDGKLFDYPVETSMIEEKEIHKSCFELKDEDMLIIMSDGVTNAGMGKTTNGGWGRDDVMAFCRAKYHKGMSAQEMAGYLAEASLDLNLNETDDDITAIVLRMRHKQVVNLMIGPPSKEEHDERYLKSFFDSEGYHVICGGTTAQCAARYLDKELISLSETACGDVPAYYKLEGTDEQLLKFDEVNNEQREVIYKERRKVLDGDNMRDLVLKMITDIVENAVDMSVSDEDTAEKWDLTELNNLLLPIIPLKSVVLTDEQKKSMKKNELKHTLKEAAIKLYETKEAEFPEPEQIREIERVVLLKVIDNKWMSHLDDMDALREGIGLQAYGQRDPVVEYKMQGYELYEAMMAAIQEETVRILFHIRVEQKIERESAAKVTGSRCRERGSPWPRRSCRPGSASCRRP